MASKKSNRIRKNHSILIPVATHLLTTTGKGIEKTAKWMATDHTRSSEYSSVTNAMHNLNYLSAKQALIFRIADRRMNRGNTIPSRSEIVCDWLIDHLLFIRDVLWGFLRPILESIFFGLLRLIAIVLVNVVSSMRCLGLSPNNAFVS